MNARWRHRPEGSTWGDFGPDDELGRLNLLTPERVLAGVREVQAGRTFCLSLPLDYPGGNVLNPRRFPPRLRATVRPGLASYNFPMETIEPDQVDVLCDDAALIYLQYSTQWDSFAHCGAMFDADGDGAPEPLYYNGFRAGVEIVGPPPGQRDGQPNVEPVEARALGIEKMAAHGVQGRGVLVDLHAHHGRARAWIGYDELMRAMEADRVTVEPGDMLCLHTGFAQLLLDLKRTPDKETLETSCTVLDGRDERLLRWITDSQISVLIGDNYAVEGLPSRTTPKGRHPGLPLHHHCLFKLGVHLGEMFYLTELAQWLRANGRSRFLLTAPPLRLPGAVGSPSTAIATV